MPRPGTCLLFSLLPLPPSYTSALSSFLLYLSHSTRIKLEHRSTKAISPYAGISIASSLHAKVPFGCVFIQINAKPCELFGSANRLHFKEELDEGKIELLPPIEVSNDGSLHAEVLFGCLVKQINAKLSGLFGSTDDQPGRVLAYLVNTLQFNRLVKIKRDRVSVTGQSSNTSNFSTSSWLTQIYPRFAPYFLLNDAAEI